MNDTLKTSQFEEESERSEIAPSFCETEDMDHSHHNHAHGQNHDHHAGMDHDAHPMAHHQQDHVEHDHGDAHAMMDHGASGHQMAMFFHGGVSEVILFDTWRINTVGGLIGSMIICFLLAILFEGLKCGREYIYSKNYTNSEPLNATDTSNIEEKQPEVEGKRKRSIQAWIKRVETNMISKVHFLQTFLHGVQLLLAYFLMLIFMTYNTWLCASIIVGGMVGYFMFGWRKTAVVELTDHCS